MTRCRDLNCGEYCQSVRDRRWGQVTMIDLYHDPRPAASKPTVLVVGTGRGLVSVIPCLNVCPCVGRLFFHRAIHRRLHRQWERSKCFPSRTLVCYFPCLQTVSPDTADNDNLQNAVDGPPGEANASSNYLVEATNDAAVLSCPVLS